MAKRKKKEFDKVPEISEVQGENFVKDDETKGKEAKQYINEHRLSVLMSMFKNYDGAKGDAAYKDPKFKDARAKFELAKASYDSAIDEGLDKRSPKVQSSFMEMLVASIDVYPNRKEIEELFGYIRAIVIRCIPVYGRNKAVDVDEVISISYERWLKYRYNFEPLKRSVISGQRVNAFAYMTQIIKNTIYEVVTRIKKRMELEERIREELYLHESYGGDSEGSVGIVNNNASGDSSDESTNHLTPITHGSSDMELSNYHREIIKCIMDNISSEKDLKSLLLKIQEDGFDPDEIIETISSYGLLEPINEVILKNKWAF